MPLPRDGEDMLFRRFAASPDLPVKQAVQVRQRLLLLLRLIFRKNSNFNKHFVNQKEVSYGQSTDCLRYTHRGN